ncbi:MAG: L-threonylcarbamoyladenylate synthase [Acidobacteriaceae bacterium]|jgi:L-threonylcarbamoyladenylate synthase
MKGKADSSPFDGLRVRNDKANAGAVELALKTERLRAEVGADVARAAELLRAGGTVAFPTETVYGLGANALDAGAVAKIFWAKERPGWDPLIVHVDGWAMVAQVARVGEGEVGRRVRALMEAFWPGPLTLLLPRTAAVPDAVTAGRELVGVRMPGHPVARALIWLAGVPVAAPSANRFGHASPTTAEHVLADLDGRIDAVLDGGATEVGVESTVAEVRGDGVVVYRPGAVTAGMIAGVVGVVAEKAEADSSAALRNDKEGALRNDKQGELRNDKQGAGRDDKEEGLVSPGMGMRHYAPRARLVLVRGQRELVEEVRRYGAAEVGVMLPEGWDEGGAGAVFGWGEWGDSEGLARRLFAGLRALDDAGATVIVCPVPEMDGLGEAMRDRLEKAARAL